MARPEKETSTSEIVDDILDAAYQRVCTELELRGIKYDSNSSDCIFYDDEGQKKTFAISIFQHECDVYEGD